MAKYIERETAQEIICGWCGVCQHPTLEDLEKCDDICPQFARIPNADVRPVVRGQWKRVDPRSTVVTFRCSECNYYAHMIATNYCPNCGADMREAHNG